MPTYNYQEGWLFYVPTINDDAEYAAAIAAGITDSDCYYIGVMKAGSGWDIQPSYSEKDNVGNDITLKFEMTIDCDVITLIDSDLRTALDGITCSLLYVPKEYASVDREAETLAFTGVTPTGILLCPTELFVGDAYKLGNQEVTALKITGKAERTTKEELYDDIELTAS